MDVEMCQRVARRQAEDRERFWEIVEEIRARNADKDPDEVYRDVTEIVEEIRQERYEQEQCAKRGRWRQPIRQMPDPLAASFVTR